MESFNTIWRSLEIHRITQDSRSSDRERNDRRRSSSIQSKIGAEFGNFKRNFQRRRRSSDVDRILAKYANYRSGKSNRNASTAGTSDPNCEKTTKQNKSLNKQLRNGLNKCRMSNIFKSSSDKSATLNSTLHREQREDISAIAGCSTRNDLSDTLRNSIANCSKLTRSTPCLIETTESKNIKSKNFKMESIFLPNGISKESIIEIPLKSNNSDNIINVSDNDNSIHSDVTVSVETVPSKKVTTSKKFKKWIKPQTYTNGAFECWIKYNRRKVSPTPSTSKIKDVDDGFFEKFGSLLRDKSMKAAKAEDTPLAVLLEDPVAETLTEEETTNVELDGTANKVAPIVLSSDSDSGNGTLLDDSDSEDLEKLKLCAEAVGWNIEELYKEILYEIQHNVGFDVNMESGQLPLLSYVQDAFKISSDKHQELLADAEAKQPPEVLLDVQVIEAKDLQPKDPNGLSDPYVTLYLMSDKTQRFSTSPKNATLNPVWEEYFSLPILKSPIEDILCLEVWDFDPAETVIEKMSKISQVKGVKGFGKLMKEVVVTASTGKHDDELIGRASIPLKSVPASGMRMWYSLEKKNKPKRGVLKLHLKFSSKKNNQVAVQEHRHLLKILLMYELENSRVAPFWWAGNYGQYAEAIITQHIAQSGLSNDDILLSQWSVYCNIHCEHPLSFSLFNNILNKMGKSIQINEEENKTFWDGVKKILPSCFSVIRKIRKKSAGDKAVMKLLKEILELINKLSELNVPNSIELFSSDKYAWLNEEDKSNLSIVDVLQKAIERGASDWFLDITENTSADDNTDEGKLQFLIKTIQLIRSDLQRAVEYYDRYFAELIRIAYSQKLYKIYEEKLSAISEPVVVEVCKSLKRLRYSTASSKNHITLADANGEGTQLGAPDVEEEPMMMGTTLFELYLILQRFLALGQGLFPTDYEHLCISKFYSWFYGGVAQWLDIAVFKALTRIEKAVELDQLVPVDESVKYSSSAVDTLAIFYQIKVFWEQLAWPDVEGSYSFIAKIVDDICRCCIFYADKMEQRVNGMGDVTTIYESKFYVTTEWCLAVNNIDYCKQNLQTFVKDLGVDATIAKLGELRSEIEAERCKETIQNVVENSLDTIRNKIIELLERIVQKMTPSISRYLLEGAELLHQDSNSMEKVMLYLEENLSNLHNNLSQDNFTRTLDVIWYQLAMLMEKLVQSNLEKRRPPSFFSNLHQCLNLMVQSFKHDNTESQCHETLERIEKLLKLHGFETTDLIHQFFIERWQEQKTQSQTPFGVLTVRAIFCESAIKIEVVNARNLLPMDSNGSVDAFVRINLLPEDVFAGAIRPKTQTHNKNLFPLFDETFTIVLTPEQRNCRNGLIMFNVKDKDMFTNQYLAEAFLHFSEIPDTHDIKSLPLIHLNLTRPTKLEGDAVTSLEHRQGDKLARDFLKKQKQKIGIPH